MINESYDDLVARYAEFEWDLSSTNRPIWSHLKLRLADGVQVKFHNLDVLESVRMEKQSPSANFPYRQGVNAIVVDLDNDFLIVQKNSYKKNEWDFPGGGLEDGENPEQGILRELHEELGSTDFQIVKQSPIIIKFDWPQENIDLGFRKYGKWWRGQEKLQFIVRFTGDKEELDMQEDELRSIKWVKYSELQEHLVFDGQWHNCKMVLQEAGLAFD